MLHIIYLLLQINFSFITAVILTNNHLIEDVCKAKHVIHIGIDGLSANCLRRNKIYAKNIVFRLGDIGSNTLEHGRTVIEATSAPGWTAHLVSMDSASSGIRAENWIPPWEPFCSDVPISPVSGSKTELPTVFKVLKSQQPSVKTAMFYTWPWIRYLGNFSIRGTLDKEVLCYPREIGYYQCDKEIIDNVRSYLRNTISKSLSPSYTFVHLDSVDHAGHDATWCSEPYKLQVRIVDELIGRLLDVLEDVNISNNTLVILSSDHGGETGSNIHGTKTDDSLIIPIYIAGPCIKRNYEFRHVIRSVDLAPTALHSMGFQSDMRWQGRIIKEIFDMSAFK